MLLDKQDKKQEKKVEFCPYCHSPKIIKKGKRKKKMEEIQIYFCKHCLKKFIPQISKSKTYPLRIILDAVTLYNRLYTTKDIVNKINEIIGQRVIEIICHFYGCEILCLKNILSKILLTKFI